MDVLRCLDYNGHTFCKCGELNVLYNLTVKVQIMQEKQKPLNENF